MVLNVDSSARRVAIILIASLATVWVGHTIWREYRVDALSRLGDRPNLESALVLAPRNAEFLNRLGRIHLYSPLGDSHEALDLLNRATVIEPRVALFWVDLALARELAGDISGAAAALARARQAEPHTPAVVWNEMNFALRRGETEHALTLAAELLREAPVYTSRAMPLLSRVTDTPLLIERVVPPNSEALQAVFEFLRADNNVAGVAPAWERVLRLNRPIPNWLNRSVINWLVQSGEVALATRLWADSSRRGWIPVPPSSLDQPFYNADFRQTLLNFGFDWHIEPHPETSVWIESRGPRAGLQSICLQFAPNARTSYANLTHYVSVEPNHHYTLRGWMRSEKLVSRTGAYLEIHELAPARPERPASVPIIGTSNWTEFVLRFTAGPQTNLIQLALLRPGSAPGEEASSGLVCLANIDWKDLGSTEPAGVVRRAAK